MRGAGVLLALAAVPAFAEPLPVLAPDAGFEVIGLTDTAVLVVSEGQTYRCGLEPVGDGFEIGTCAAVVPSARMAEAALARQAAEQALTEALARAEAAEQERDALRADVAARRDAEAAALSARDLAQAERDALAAELETARAAATADLDALRFAANLRPTVIALEQAAVNVGLVDEARLNVLAKVSLLLLAKNWGDGCTLQQSAFAPENERAQQQVVIDRVLNELGVKPEVAALMIANLHPDDTDPALPHNRMEAALKDALKAGDGDTYDKGTAALRLARRNLTALGDRIGQRIMAGDLIVMAEDRSSLRVAVPPCRP